MTTVSVTATTATIGETPVRARLVTAPLVRIILADLGAMTSFYLLLSAVPMFVSSHSGAALGAGLATGALMVASVGGELVTPRLAAAWDYRRLLVLGLILLGAPALAMPFATELVTLLVLCVMRGLGFAVIVVSIGVLATETVPLERRGEGLGLMGVVTTVPAIVALPLGVWLSDAVGFAAVFVVGAAASLVAVGAVIGLPSAIGAIEDAHGLRAVLRRAELLLPAAVFAGTAVAAGVVITFLPDATRSGSLASFALLVQTAAATSTRWLAGRYSDRHCARRLVLPALVTTAVGMALVAYTGSALAVLAGMLVLGVGFGTAQSASLNAMLECASRREYGAVSAAWNMAYDLGWGAGTVLVGLSVGPLGFSGAFVLTAALVIATAPIALRCGR